MALLGIIAFSLSFAHFSKTTNKNEMANLPLSFNKITNNVVLSVS